MIAAQVDDPRDFVQPRALGPSDVAMRTRAIEAVRKGQDPGTQWKDTVLDPDRDATAAGDSESMRAHSRRQRNRRRAAGRSSGRANRSGAACIDPGVLRIAGYRRHRQRRDLRSQNGQSALQAKHGRRASRDRGLSRTRRRRTLSSSRRRRAASALLEQLEELAQYCDAGTKVVVLGKLERHRSLSAAHRAWRQRISGGAVWRRRLRPGDLPSVQRPRLKAAWAGGRGRRRQRRSRSLDGRSQSGLEPRLAHRHGDGYRGFGSRRSEPPGSISIRTRPRASARRCSRPSASTPCWWTGCCPNAATISACWRRPRRLIGSWIFPRPPSIRCSTPCGRRRLGLFLMCRTCGRDGRGGSSIAADEVVVVASPDLANLRNAKNLIDNIKGGSASTIIRRGWSSTGSAC